jgi:uncharacterized membrane protein
MGAGRLANADPKDLPMIRYFLWHELRVPLFTLLLASILGTMLIAARALLTGQGLQAYLVWNLFLAWLPLLFTLRIEASEALGLTRGWRFWATFAAWLLFFPNAPYIFTDLTHLKFPIRPRWWTDLIIILLFALIGMVLAFISLQRMQRLLSRRRGALIGWAFVFGVIFLSAFGVYIGRFERWNSWDVIANPVGLMADSSSWLHWNSFRFTILFGLFLSMVYALLYSITWLGRTLHTPPSVPRVSV